MKLASSIGQTANLSLSVFHSALKSYVQTKHSASPLVLLRQALRSRTIPNDVTFSLLIKACVSLPSSSATAVVEADQLHTQLIKWGAVQFLYVSTALQVLFMKLGRVTIARHLFDSVPEKDLVSWNALLCGYSRNGCDYDALEFFIEMRREGLTPCHITLVSVLPSCGCYELFVQGKSIHGFGIRAGLDSDSRVKNALTSMYAKCRSLGAAELLFGEMGDKGVISWNTMIGVYGQNGFPDEAMLIFKEMLDENVDANAVTIVSILSANASPDPVHCFAIKTGIVQRDSVITSLVCSYSRCGKIDSAELLSLLFPQKNLVSLTAIISSHAEKGNMLSVLECFSRMQQLDMKLDAVALVSILLGITNPDHFFVGLAFHGYGWKTGLNLDCLVANGLISLYSRFDEIEAVFSLFLEMPEKPLISWNSVISGCMQSGRSIEAMNFFHQMQISGHRPDAITVSGLLSNCCQLGNLHFGKMLHGYVLRNNLEAEDFIGTALIDMYSKCGDIEHAERVFKSAKSQCLAAWNAMISGFSLFGCENKAFSFYAEMIGEGLKPDRITFLGLLAACTHGGLVQEASECFHTMKTEFGIVPGLQHFACMVSLLGRAGLLEEAIMFVKNMDIEPDSAVWGALLTGCCIHQEVKLGECLAKKLFFADDRNGGLYVLMSNLYAATGRWEDVERVRDTMRDTQGDGCFGVSIIETDF